MENLTADIRDGHTVKLTKQAKDKILECAKAIKSNDNTFKISTLPEVGDELRGLMNEYVQAMRTLEASHNAFEQMRDDLEAEETDAAIDEPVDLIAFEELYKANLEKHNQGIPSDTSALKDLEQILKPVRPQDEDIEVEETSTMQIPKDPITQTNIKKAFRNKVCNHIYDITSITEYFKQKEKNKSRVPCPVAGCTVKAMKMSELIPDQEINDLIEKLKDKKSS